LYKLPGKEQEDVVNAQDLHTIIPISVVIKPYHGITGVMTEHGDVGKHTTLPPVAPILSQTARYFVATATKKHIRTANLRKTKKL
jgi:hypothetical protein